MISKGRGKKKSDIFSAQIGELLSPDISRVTQNNMFVPNMETTTATRANINLLLRFFIKNWP